MNTPKTATSWCVSAGTVIRPGLNVAKGSDDTLFALADGIVKFTNRRVRRFTGAFKMAKYVNVNPIAAGAKQ